MVVKTVLTTPTKLMPLMMLLKTNQNMNFLENHYYWIVLCLIFFTNYSNTVGELSASESLFLCTKSGNMEDVEEHVDEELEHVSESLNSVASNLERNSSPSEDDPSTTSNGVHSRPKEAVSRGQNESGSSSDQSLSSSENVFFIN